MSIFAMLRPHFVKGFGGVASAVETAVEALAGFASFWQLSGWLVQEIASKSVRNADIKRISRLRVEVESEIRRGKRFC